MYILGIHSGNHDASACLFRDYELVAAVSLERLTRKKNDGISAEMELPSPAIAECLGIAGIGPGDVDVVCQSRGHLELQSYRLRGRWRLKQQFYGLIGKPVLMSMILMMRKQGTMDAAAIFDAESFRRRYGFTKATMHFFNHHHAHALPAYFFSEFDDALIY